MRVCTICTIAVIPHVRSRRRIAIVQTLFLSQNNHKSPKTKRTQNGHLELATQCASDNAMHQTTSLRLALLVLSLMPLEIISINFHAQACQLGRLQGRKISLPLSHRPRGAAAAAVATAVARAAHTGTLLMLSALVFCAFLALLILL
eukprot:4794574-Prymnesium_polylepis.1